MAGFREGAGEFILIFGSTKSGRIYTPLNAFETALGMKRDFEEPNTIGALQEWMLVSGDNRAWSGGEAVALLN